MTRRDLARLEKLLAEAKVKIDEPFGPAAVTRQYVGIGLCRSDIGALANAVEVLRHMVRRPTVKAERRDETVAV